MLACSYIWVLLGVGNYRQIPTQRPNVLHLELAPDLRGLIWLLPVLIAVFTCLSRRWSWVGVGALFFPPFVTMVSYAQSWAAFEVDGGSAGYPDGWYQSAIYLGACLIPILAALFPSPSFVEVGPVPPKKEKKTR